MFSFWIVLGLLLILLGIFNRQILPFLGIKLMSDMFTNRTLAQATRHIEKIGRWLVITLGTGFLVQGLDGALPNDLSSTISFLLLGAMGLMFLAIIGITITHWKVK